MTAIIAVATVRLLALRRAVPCRSTAPATAAHLLWTGLTLGTLKSTLIIPIHGSLRVHSLRRGPIFPLDIGTGVAPRVERPEPSVIISRPARRGILDPPAAHPLLRRPVGSTRSAGVHHFATSERAWPARRGDPRASKIPSCSLSRISSREPPLLKLLADGPVVAFPGSSPLFARGTEVYSSRAAMIADSPVAKVMELPAVVNMGKVSALESIHRTVVIKAVVVPVAAMVAVTRVTKPVVDAAVPAD